MLKQSVLREFEDGIQADFKVMSVNQQYLTVNRTGHLYPIRKAYHTRTCTHARTHPRSIYKREFVQEHCIDATRVVT